MEHLKDGQILCPFKYMSQEFSSCIEFISIRGRNSVLLIPDIIEAKQRKDFFFLVFIHM